MDPWEFQRWAYSVKTGSPARKSVLMVLATMADANTGRCEPKQATLAEACEMSERSVRSHLKAMEDAGLIARRHQQRLDGSRRSDEFLMHAPWVTEWPDGEKIQPAESAAGPSGNGASIHPEADGQSNRQPVAAQERPKGTTIRTRQDERVRNDAFPDDLPESMHDAAIEVGKVLKRTALARGQKREVTRAAVGHALVTFPDRPHLKVARDVEYWLMHGRGARKPCADIVARFRQFLETSEPEAGPPLPASSVGRPRGGGASADDFAAIAAGR